MRHSGVVLGPQSPLLTPARARRLLAPDEVDIQKAVLEALVGKLGKGEQRTLGRGLTGKYPELMLLYAINPNKGGNRSRAARGISKAMGLLPGMPDLHLPVMRGPFIGLYLEMKRPGGSVGQDQRAMHELLRQEGHLVAVCKTAQSAVRFVTDYLNLPTNRPSLWRLDTKAREGIAPTDALAWWRKQQTLMLNR